MLQERQINKDTMLRAADAVFLQDWTIERAAEANYWALQALFFRDCIIERAAGEKNRGLRAADVFLNRFDLIERAAGAKFL